MWRKRYGELEVADVRRLRELEAQNARLNKMVCKISNALHIKIRPGGNPERMPDRLSTINAYDDSINEA